MRRIHTVFAFVLVALGVCQVPAFSVYSCRMDGEIHAACCCSSQDCASTEADCACCDVLQVEIKALASPSPSCPSPEDVLSPWTVDQEHLSDRSLLCSKARFSNANTSAEDLPPPPRIALCIQRI